MFQVGTTTKKKNKKNQHHIWLRYQDTVILETLSDVFLRKKVSPNFREAQRRKRLHLKDLFQMFLLYGKGFLLFNHLSPSDRLEWEKIPSTCFTLLHVLDFCQPSDKGAQNDQVSMHMFFICD